MSTHTDNITIIKDARGKPAFVVLPVSDYEALALGRKSEDVHFPIEVVESVLTKNMTLARAWREHFSLSQAEVASRLGVTQGAYSKLESKKKLKPDVREKLADALGIEPEQLEL
jgi:DNA-binding XRE family transcriptional regulator